MDKGGRGVPRPHTGQANLVYTLPVSSLTELPTKTIFHVETLQLYYVKNDKMTYLLA